jgi:hypothetical protein
MSGHTTATTMTIAGSDGMNPAASLSTDQQIGLEAESEIAR